MEELTLERLNLLIDMVRNPDMDRLIVFASEEEAKKFMKVAPALLIWLIDKPIFISNNLVEETDGHLDDLV